MNSLPRSFTREWQRQGEKEYSLCPGPWKRFLHAAATTVRVLQFQQVWESPMNFFFRSAAEPILCFPDGIESEMHETEDADIVN